MGVITDDEVEEMLENQRALRAVTVGGPSGLASRLIPSSTGEGFNGDHVSREIESATAGKAPAAAPATEPAAAEPADNANEQPKTEDAKTEVDDAAVRNSPDAGSTSQAEEGSDPAGKTEADPGQSSTGSPTGDDTAAAGGNAAGGSPFNFKAFSDELNKATQQKSLKAFSDAFRLKNAWTTETEAAETLRKIYEVHQRRIKDKTDFKEVHAELSELGAI